MTIPYQTMTRATELELVTTGHWLRSNEGALNFADLINSRLKDPVRVGSSNSVEAFSDIDRVLRTRSGQVANGTWIPLSMLQPSATRELNTTNGAPLKAATVAASATASLLPTSGVISGGAQVLTGLKGDTVSLPYVDNVTGGGQWHQEGVAPVTPAEISFLLAVLQPRSIAVELVITRSLLKNTSIDLDALVREELALRFGAAIDAAALAGDGILEPQGLLNSGDLDVFDRAANGAAIAIADLAELEARVLSRANGCMTAPGWIMGPKLTRKLRATPKGTGGNMLYEGADLLGYRVVASSVIPENLTKGTSTDCSALIFGDLHELVIGFWGPAALDLLIDGYTMAHQQKIRIVARAEVGIVARRVGAFAAIKDALNV